MDKLDNNDNISVYSNDNFQEINLEIIGTKINKIKTILNITTAGIHSSNISKLDLKNIIHLSKCHQCNKFYKFDMILQKKCICKHCFCCNNYSTNIENFVEQCKLSQFDFKLYISQCQYDHDHDYDYNISCLLCDHKLQNSQYIKLLMYLDNKKIITNDDILNYKYNLKLDMDIAQM